MKTFEQVPLRAPLQIVEEVKALLEGRIVCEIGHSAGDLLARMSMYADEVIGVEPRQEVFDKSTKHEYQCPTTLILDNFPECIEKIKHAEVFYLWINAARIKPWIETIKEHAPMARIIVAGDPGNRNNNELQLLKDLEKENLGWVHEFEYIEVGQRGNTFAYLLI